VSKVRVLVVEDYAPFRRFVCSTLGKNQELRVVGEASDGFEAVNKAEELRPDLIVLDIGLPTLNGIEAVRRIREFSPESKIVFVSQESSADVVREALGTGARGYVVKGHAGSELLTAVGTVLEGGQFISGGLTGLDAGDAANLEAGDQGWGGAAQGCLVPKKSEVVRSHEVAFYSDDAAFVAGFSDFIEDALEAGKAVIVVATAPRRNSLLQRLREQGVDVVAAIERGFYLALDVGETLSTFMENELPDPVRFFKVVGDLIAGAARATAGEKSRVVICGESASILWAEGKADAAIQVEQFCNHLTKRYEMDILCGFSLSSFFCEEDKQIFEKICSEY